jgi:hypothetical protein
MLYNEDIYYGIGDDDFSTLTGLGDPYPNPARSSVNIEFNLLKSGQVQVFIFNQGGQVAGKYSAHHQNGENHIRLNTERLTSGIYKMMVLFGNEKHVKSFVKIN